MKCVCGYENGPGARYCGKCGSAIGTEFTAGDPSIAASVPSTLTLPPAEKSDVRRAALIVAALVVILAGFWLVLRPHGRRKPDNSGLYVILVNGKYGYMNRSGKTVITPQFDTAYAFTEGLALVKTGTKFGYTNTKGELVITPQFEEAAPFSDGLAAVRIGTKYGYIDKKGVVTITPQFDNAIAFHQGRAAVKLCCGPVLSGERKIGKVGQDRYGFIDRKGNYIGGPTFLSVHWDFGDRSGWRTGDATVVRTAEDRIAVLNASGEVLTVEKADEMGWEGFAGGLAPVAVEGKWGYIDPKGKWVITPQFENVHGFEDGLAPVEVGQRWGLIDRKGTFVVNPQYDHIYGISEGYAIFETGQGAVPGCRYCNNYGFIDTKGHVAVPARFGQFPEPTGGFRSPVAPFSEGLAAVKTDDGWGFIDPSGKMVIPPLFDEASGFEDGIAHVSVLGKDAYITNTGEFIVEPFPGTTARAMKQRVTGAADQAKQKILGEWMGRFGRLSFAHLTVNADGSVAVTLPEWRGQASWRDVFRGKLDHASDAPTVSNATLLSADGSMKTFRANLNYVASNDSVVGDLIDANRNSVGRIELSRAGD